jgi:hypothetical protein
MRRMTIIGLCAVAALAICAVAAGSASAAPPEFGRCIKKAKVEGSGFSDSSCTTAVSSGAKDEWVPGPGPKAHFTSVARFVPSTNYKRCLSAQADEELAKEKEEAANRAEAEGDVALAEKLREEAAKLRAEAAALRAKAGLSKEECEKIIVEEEGKEPVVLETVNGQRVECSGLSASGEYSGPKTIANLTTTFTGCELANTEISCQSGATSGEIVSQTLKGELGWDKQEADPTKSKVGIDLTPSSGSVVSEFNCGGFFSIVVSGSVIHDVKGNKMLLEENEKLVQKNGEQKPEKFEGLPADILETSIGGGPVAQSGLGLLSRLVNEEKIEVNTVV